MFLNPKTNDTLFSQSSDNINRYTCHFKTFSCPLMLLNLLCVSKTGSLSSTVWNSCLFYSYVMILKTKWSEKSTDLVVDFANGKNQVKWIAYKSVHLRVFTVLFQMCVRKNRIHRNVLAWGPLLLHIVAVWVNNNFYTPQWLRLFLSNTSTSRQYTDDSNADRHCNGTLNSTAYTEWMLRSSKDWIMWIILISPQI